MNALFRPSASTSGPMYPSPSCMPKGRLEPTPWTKYMPNITIHTIAGEQNSRQKKLAAMTRVRRNAEGILEGLPLAARKGRDRQIVQSAERAAHAVIILFYFFCHLGSSCVSASLMNISVPTDSTFSSKSKVSL